MAEMTYTIREIAEATGINEKTLGNRAKVLRKAGELPPIKGRAQARYTYDQVKKIVMQTLRGPAKPRPAAIEALKRQLMNDGYPVNRSGSAK
ncbi:MAG: MerR family transcriptional regulator [Oscillospiraceae bacterium]|nr:MerR family transcriptional regulator [Oscillospiraceae bacterium]